MASSSLQRHKSHILTSALVRMIFGKMDVGMVVGSFKGKSILVTGSTGFLGKVLVEKILRVQPDVRKLYILIRANDVESAKLRMQSEVIGVDIFRVLKEKHGLAFNSFIEEKVCPLAGDIMYDNFGMDIAKLKELSKDIDIIVNGAATTNFYERYDVSFNVNVLGVKHLCAFAKTCIKLKMLVHLSTAYVAGEQTGLIPEKPFLMGETLRVGTYLDIDAEQNLINNARIEMETNNSTEMAKKKTMKEMGLKRARYFGWPNTYVFTKAMGEMMLGNLQGDFSVVIIRPSIITSTLKDPFPGWIEDIRTIDTVIIGYANQTFSSFLASPDAILDMIPGDMVVNAMMVAMAAHLQVQAHMIYHVTSSVRNPATVSILEDSMNRYFFDKPPCIGRNAEHVRLKKMRFYDTSAWLGLYTAVMYKLPLQMLHLVNILLCGIFSRRYNELSKKYRFITLLIEIYKPYSFFKGCFDDLNLEKLRMAMTEDENNNGGYYFDFDPKRIDWNDYLYGIHIPGLLKHTCGLN